MNFQYLVRKDTKCFANKNHSLKKKGVWLKNLRVL